MAAPLAAVPYADASPVSYETVPPSAVPPPLAPPRIVAAGDLALYPRATFLDRVAAIAIDCILVAIAVPSFRLLFQQLDIPKADITIKATGKQWYWSYAYPDNGKFEFDSLMLQDNERKPDQPRLLAVDNEMVVPVNKVIRIQTTGADVIHAFAVPAFGIKIDAIPGRLNETWFKATKVGMFYGQCSELCGKDHAYMPIVLRVVSEDAYKAWLASVWPKLERIAAYIRTLRQQTLTKPPGSLGRLEDLAIWLARWQRREIPKLERVTVAVESGLQTLILEHAEAAAERTDASWRSVAAASPDAAMNAAWSSSGVE